MGFIDEINQRTNLQLLVNQSMKKHTAYGVGGVARFYSEAKSVHSLNTAYLLCKKYHIPCKIIGNGTNILFSDKGYDGLIISTKGISEIFQKGNKIRATCGVNLKKLIDYTSKNSLTGVEMLTGIPASIGGAIYMNAGAFNHEISENIIEVESVSDGKLVKRFKEDCQFKYRESIFNKNGEIILSATFEFKEGNVNTINEKIQSVLAVRKTFQPTGKSLGCVFKNPKKFSAGQLIDALGLKGYKIGGASISEKHGNFIVTDSTATATDVVELINYIKEKVYKAFNIKLEEEIEIIGDF